MKKFLTVIASLSLAVLVLFCGCSVKDGRDGRDGKDAQDVSVYDLYEAAKTIEGNENLTLDEFLREYLSYNSDDAQASAGFQATVNKSLMAGVSILSRFSYSDGSHNSSLGIPVTRKSYKVFTGSGVIVSIDREAGDAYVVTNCHVVYDDTSDTTFCDDIRLYLYGQDEQGANFSIDTSYNITGDDNYRIEAEVIGASVNYDIALLKVTGSEVLKRSDAVSATFSTASECYIGETVYAVGNASGEGLSAADGIISKDSEYIELSLSEKPILTSGDYYQYRVLRTTAPINHGNSGGALYNTKGEIIAIVNAKDEGEDVDNMGYALPANCVRRLVKLMYDNYVENGSSMLKGGGIKKALLNITTVASDSYARYNKQTGLAEIYETVTVRDVSGMPAMGKLQSGDYLKGAKVMGTDGTLKENIEVTRRYHVQEMMFSVRKGDTVILTVERDGTLTDVSIIFNSDNYFTKYA